MFCVQCGKENPQGASYCSACGKPVTSVADTIAAPQAAEVTPLSEGVRPPDRADVAGGKACPACGRLNPNAAERCGCGVSFISGVGSRIPPPYAGFWIRVAASVLDGLVIGAISSQCPPRPTPNSSRAARQDATVPSACTWHVPFP
jgi:hypothetical protein